MRTDKELFESIADCDVASVSRLVAAGVDVNAIALDGQSVWSFAVPAGVRAIRLALDSGADPNLLDGANRSALYWAIQANDADAVALLFHAGAKLEIGNSDDGDNFLHEAAVAGADAALRELVRNAPPHYFSARNLLGRTPYDEAIAANNHNCAKILSSKGSP